MPRLTSGLLLAFVLGWMTLSGARAADRPLHLTYQLTPLEHGFAVDLRFRGDARGRVTLDLPDEAMGEKERWRLLSDFAVRGAAMTAPDSKTRVLSFAPGARVSLHYVVHAAYDTEPDGTNGNPYKGALVRPTWFAALGDFLFVTPQGGDLWPATFKWGPVRKGWTVATDLAQPGAKTVTDMTESTILGGTDVAVYRRAITGGSLSFAVRGSWTFDVAKFVDELARTISAQRDFWHGDVKGPYLVTLFPMLGAGSSGGTGRGDGFALYGTLDTPEAIFRRTVAHEHLHSWIPNRIGTLRDGPDEPMDYWFSEGFTDFYTDRTLLGGGIWSLEDFVADLNDKLTGYANSPVRNAPNARIVKEFWTDYGIETLPYQRGMLLAFLWDWKLRKTGKGDMDAVMFAARDRFAHAPAGGKPNAVENFIASYDRLGPGLAPDLKRYVEDGETVTLPPDLFGACATVRDVEIASFDPGFDRDKSAAAGVFVGVDPKGPAFAAGLRDGMKRIRRVSGKEGDSRVPLGYRVADANGERDISWLPAGTGRLALQQVELTPGMDAQKRKACVFHMGAGTGVLR